LQHRDQLGDESLCREVADSISWRRFGRIGLDRPVPHPTTLVKLVRRAGPESIAQLNSALLDKLAQDKLLRGRKLRADTTVVEADIDYPPMPGCWPMRWQAGWAGAARQGPGSGQPDPVPDRGRVAGRRMGKLGQTLRRRSGEAMAEVQRVTAELAGLARQTLGQVQPVWRNARRALRRRPRMGGLRGWSASWTRR
jgi:transposase, IS5 family